MSYLFGGREPGFLRGGGIRKGLKKGGVRERAAEASNGEEEENGEEAAHEETKVRR